MDNFDNNDDQNGNEESYHPDEDQDILNEAQESKGEGDEVEYVDFVEIEESPELPPKKQKSRYVNTIFVAIISAIIGGLVVSLIVPNFYGVIHKPEPPINITVDETVNIATAVAKKSMPSIVGITTKSTQELLFGFRTETEGVGTGVIVDSGGFILTNSHVVDDGKAKEVKVLLYDGDTINAKILWHDPAMDLAVLKIVATALAPASLGDSDKLKVGEVAIAIGNPLGLSFERSVTQGIISGLNRSLAVSEVETIDGLIQTDASINPGNSGGPLINSKGEVIGINTIKMQTGEGLGFAIPINTAKPIVDEIIENGEFKKAYIGIRGINIDALKAYNEDVPIDSGVFVYQVFDGAPAQKAGIGSGDIIIGIEEHEVGTVTQLNKALYNYRPGDTIGVKIYRNGKETTIKLKLE